MESKIDKTLGSRKEWQVPGAGLRGKWGGVRIHLQCRRLWFNSWVRKISWRKDRLPTPVFLGFPDGSISKEFVRHAGDLGSIPGLGRSLREGHGNHVLHGYPVFLPGESPGTEKPGGLQSMGSQRVGQDWATNRRTVKWHKVSVIQGK